MHALSIYRLGGVFLILVGWIAFGHTTLLTWSSIWSEGILLYCSKMVLAGSLTQSCLVPLLFISCLIFSL